MLAKGVKARPQRSQNSPRGQAAAAELVDQCSPAQVEGAASGHGEFSVSEPLMRSEESSPPITLRSRCTSSDALRLRQPDGQRPERSRNPRAHFPPGPPRLKSVSRPLQISRQRPAFDYAHRDPPRGGSQRYQTRQNDSDSLTGSTLIVEQACAIDVNLFIDSVHASRERKERGVSRRRAMCGAHAHLRYCS